MSVRNVDMNGKPTVISTFAGCGGSSLGYKWAGFEELLAIEWDDNAVETFVITQLKNLVYPIIATLKWVVSGPEMSRKCGKKSRKFSHRLTRVFARTLSGIYRCAIWGVSGVSNAQSLLVRSIAPQLTNRNTRRCLWHQ